jgi:hypothetical protein
MLPKYVSYYANVLQMYLRYFYDYLFIAMTIKELRNKRVPAFLKAFLLAAYITST